MTDGIDELELTRYGTIAEIISRSEDKLLNTHRSQYFTIDTGFLTPEGLPGMWAWLTGGLQRLVRLSASIASESLPHRFHRMFIVPEPAEYENNFQRSLYRRIVKDVLHYHLWHGVVAYVVYIRRRDYDTAAVLRAADFGAVAGLVYDTSNYYARTFKGLKVVEGSSAQSYVKHAMSVLRPNDLRNVLRLYYDPVTFQHTLRSDLQWEHLREFFYRLQSGVCPGPDCVSRPALRDSHLDHIIQRNASNNVLLNLRILCAACNRNKGKWLTHELPFAAAYAVIPADIATEEVKSVISDVEPPWLQRYTGPPVNVLRELGV